MSDRDEFGAFLVGFIVGGLTGAVVALLFAPQSGEETRALIKDKSIELRDKATAEAEAIRIQAQAIQSQGGAEYVNLKAIEKWDGGLPQYLGGNTPIPFINVGGK